MLGWTVELTRPASPQQLVGRPLGLREIRLDRGRRLGQELSLVEDTGDERGEALVACLPRSDRPCMGNRHRWAALIGGACMNQARMRCRSAVTSLCM